MLLVELRLPLPLSVEECERAFMFVFSLESEPCIQSGVKCLVHQPTVRPDNHVDLFTKRQFNYSSFFPQLLTRLVPRLRDVWFDEESSYKFPDIDTVTRCDYLGDKFVMRTRSHTEANDSGTKHNVFGLDAAQLAQRQVRVIDLMNTPNSLREELDAEGKALPGEFRHIHKPDWFKDAPAPACSYTLLEIRVEGVVMQSTVEKMIAKDCAERTQMSRLRAVVLRPKWQPLSVLDVLRLDRDFERRAHEKQHLPPPEREPLPTSLEPAQQPQQQPQPPRSSRSSRTLVEPLPNGEGEDKGEDKGRKDKDKKRKQKKDKREKKEKDKGPEGPGGEKKERRGRKGSKASITAQPSANADEAEQEKREIRRQVKQWYRDFVAKYNREPLDKEYAENLRHLYVRAKKLEWRGARCSRVVDS